MNILGGTTIDLHARKCQRLTCAKSVGSLEGASLAGDAALDHHAELDKQMTSDSLIDEENTHAQ
jgi:hypothetical protein